jgi:hypothetical protein
MPVAATETAVVFFPFTNRLHGDPELKREALHVRELLTSGELGKPQSVPILAAQWFHILPVDGLGRTLPCEGTPDGQLPRDLWLRFAQTAVGCHYSARRSQPRFKSQRIESCGPTTSGPR